MLKVKRIFEVLRELRGRLVSCPNTEGEQSALRVLIVSGVFAYLHGAKAFHDKNGVLTDHFNFWLTIVVVCFAWIILISIVFSPRKVEVRRLLGTVVDVSATVYGIYATDALGSPLYAVLMWIIFGNGVRFGARYLYIATALGAGGFLWVINVSEFWKQNSYLSWGLMTGLIVIPLYGT